MVVGRMGFVLVMDVVVALEVFLGGIIVRVVIVGFNATEAILVRCGVSVVFLVTFAVVFGIIILLDGV